MSGERHNDYKLGVSSMLMSRDVSFIMVTDTRKGLWVKPKQGRKTTAMKNI